MKNLKGKKKKKRIFLEGIDKMKFSPSSAHVAIPKAVSQLINGHVVSRVSHMTQILRTHVELNSFTGHHENITAMATKTHVDLFSQFARIPLPSSSSPNGSHQHLFLKSPSPPSSSTSSSVNIKNAQRPQIALVSHLDTVFPPATAFGWQEALLPLLDPSKPHSDLSKVKIVKDLEAQTPFKHIAIGPGTMDIKGGTVVMAMALEALLHAAPQHYHAVDWRILLNAAEEILDSSFPKAALESQSISAEVPPLACLVFENGPSAFSANEQSGPATPTGLCAFSLVVGRKGMGIWQIEVTGKDAHAGNAHAKGANAIVALSHLITKISALTDYSRQVTVNVGLISGGTTTNTVPGRAQCVLEMRAADTETFAEIEQKLLSLVKEEIRHFPGCISASKVVTEAPPWMENEGSDELLSLWNHAAKSLGEAAPSLQPPRNHHHLEYWCVGERRGGLSDGNRFWQLCPTLDGLGPTGFNAHCSSTANKPPTIEANRIWVEWEGRKLEVLMEPPIQEYVELDSIAPKAALSATGLFMLIDSYYKSLGIELGTHRE